MEFKNGYLEQITKNAEQIKTLYRMREDCKRNFDKEIEEVKGEIVHTKDRFSKQLEKMDNKFSWLYALLLTNLGGIVVMLVKMLIEGGK